MIPRMNGKRGGIVYTFYSFKGGVGRTMALANVAALLARWGYSVLAVDWDLEAPGLERFFVRLKTDIEGVRAKTPGIVDLVHAHKNQESLNWRDCLIRADEMPLALLSAGRSDPDYSSRLQSLNFPELFEKNDLGTYTEQLRNEWIAEYDFVLVDSRTGVTDIGGICTVHLADVLVVLFTTTESSMEGAIDIVERARKAQQRLPLDRGRLLAVPVPARDESRTEYERATDWKKTFAERFNEFYLDWLPSGKTAHDAIELLRIPYVPYWSFGERLPAIEEGTTDPASLGHAFEILARILEKRLDWKAALPNLTLGPTPVPRRRELDIEWLERHRRAALDGLASAGMNGFMEICHFCPSADISKAQRELLSAATQAEIKTGGIGIGIVPGSEGLRPAPTKDGIVAHFTEDTSFMMPVGRIFSHWALNKNGDFFCVISLAEDHTEKNRAQKLIGLEPRIQNAAETLLHCASLYKLLGIEPNTHVELTVEYGGLKGRTLAWSLHQSRNLYEDNVATPVITFKIGAVETELVDLVKRLCEPLFVLFDFATFPDDVYRQIVNDFVNGKVA